MNTDQDTFKVGSVRRFALVTCGYGLVLTPFIMAFWQTESGTYLIIGRMFFPTYVGAGAGLWVLDRMLGQARDPLVQAGFWLCIVALSVGLVGDIGAYYGGGGDGAKIAFSAVQSIFYGAVEFPAVIAVQVGTTIYGIGLVRSRLVDRRVCWAIVTLGPLGLLLWPLHIPSGPLFVINLYLAVAMTIGTPWPRRPRHQQGPGLP